MSKDLVKEITKQVVKTTSLFKVDDTFNDERFCRVRIAAMHSGVNRNNSSFDTSVIKKAKNTFKNIPILAEVVEHEDKDGNRYLDYGTHAFHVEEDAFNADEYRLIYDEKVVGIVPESNNFEIVHDEDTDRDYVYVDALLYRDYGNYVCDILEKRGGKTDVSMEINCEDISVRAKDNVMVVNEMQACAITLLGADVMPGMAKANAQMFSLNETDRESQLIELLSELNKKLDSFNISNSGRKEENRMKKDFEEEGITSEESTEDTPDEKADFEETPKKKKSEDDDSAILIDKDDESDDDDDQQQDDGDSDDQQDDDDSEDESEEPTEPEVTETQSAEDNGTDADDPEDVSYYSIDYTVNVNGEKKEFSVSLKEKLNALTTLVNDTYGELDGAWFDCDVIEDSKIVEFHDWWANKHYRQSYSVKKDVYSLVGDRVETFMLFATADEKKQLEQMKANYSSIEEKLQQYEAEPEKLEVFANTDYDQIRETEAFKELSKRESYFAMSKEEIAEKLDGLLLEFAKNHKIEFSADAEQKKSVGMKLFGNPSKKSTGTKSRYGGIFSK